MAVNTVRRRIGVSILMLAMCASGYGQWTEPQPLVEINTNYVDKSPFLSFDGQTLYFCRQAGPGWYYTRMYQATRIDPNGPFTSVAELSALNYFGGHVEAPWVSPDNLRMYYFRTEPGSQSRLKLSTRSSATSPWLEGVDISELNALGRIANPTLTEDELTIVFSGSNLSGGMGAYDLWMATRPAPDLPFSNVINLVEANSSDSEYHPALSGDGLALYFTSNRTGSTALFKSMRASVDVPFGVVEQLTYFESPSSIPDYPFISADGTEFYYTQDYGEGPDIYRAFHFSEPNVEEPDTVAGDYFVDALNGRDSNTGRSPATAFATIQRAVLAAGNSDVVVLADGLYAGSGNKNIDFGGRAITIQSANGPQFTIVDCENSGQGFIFQSGEDISSVLDGLTISNGNAQTAGGIYCRASGPLIRNCVITNNSGYYSAGIYCSNESSPVISNCEISWNTGTYGGGVRLVQSDGLFEHCLIIANTCSSSGAGLKSEYGSKNPMVSNCTLVGNVASQYGGALWASYSSLTLRNSIVTDNSAAFQGDQMAVGTFGSLTVAYSNVRGGQDDAYQASGNLVWEAGNIDVDPNFADPDNGDYHLKSARGRYWNAHGVWVLDEMTSDCIDAGNPDDSTLLERPPHGNVINMGAYGGTDQGSLSLISDGGQSSTGDVNGDGFIDMTDLFVLIDNWLTEYGASMVGIPQ